MKSNLIIGTAQFGLDYGINNKLGKPSDNEVENILLRAYKNNILLLDTAEAYGDSQKRIGQFHSNHPDTRFNIITKFSKSLFSGDFRKHVLDDLKELNIDNLFAYLFHNKADLDRFKDNYSELVKLKEEGLIRKIGVSLYTNKEIIDVVNNYSFIDIVQIPFNLLDNVSQRGGVIDQMKEKGIEVHTRSAFLQGLFFKEKLPKNLYGLKPYIDKINSISKKHNIPLPELALNYCLAQKNIDKVLIGVEKEEQLINNIEMVHKVPNELIEEINKIDVQNKELLNPANW